MNAPQQTRTPPSDTIRGMLDVPWNFQHPLLKRKQTILCVSLLNGRFKALAITKNSIGLSWEKPGLVVSSQTLYQALEEAISRTDFKGTHLAMLVEDPRFLSCTVQYPPMAPPDLMAVLERRVQQEKTWEGPAAWTFRRGLNAREKTNLHLEIWPQDCIDDIIHMSRQLGLDLRQLTSLSSLSESQLFTLPGEPGQGKFLVTILEGKITFVSGKDDGTLIWVRHLQPMQDWVIPGERIGTEIHRTLMFLHQQTNLDIPHVWFLGEENDLTLQEIQPHLTTPLLPFPIQPDWKYWLWVVGTIPINQTNNFTPSHVLQTPMRDRLTKIAAAMVILLMMVGVGTTGVLKGYLTKYQSTFQDINTEASLLLQIQERWKGRLKTIQTQREWTQAIKPPPSVKLEGLFLSYLGTVIPAPVILQKALLEKTHEGWAVELSGRTSVDLSKTLWLLDQLVERLSTGPFRVAIQENWRTQLLTQPITASIEEGSPQLHQFVMKGTIS